SHAGRAEVGLTMVRFATTMVIGMTAVLAAILALPARAAVLVVPPGGTGLQSAIAEAQPGDVIRLEAGEHRGPIVLDAPLMLEGEAGAIVVGSGSGSVITVNAEDVVVSGLEIRGSG